MRPDFSLIWGADNAPFTPIEASDYTAGWVFRTGAPPRRVNFDYWQNLSDQRSAWLAGVVDSVRIDVASASNVDLTTVAPDTRGIRITGTTTITGFTISAGETYSVTFSAALTLTNGLGLVTNRAGNIITAPGDSCIIRATAENTVEILCGSFLIDRALGSGQTWQSVTRTSGTNYTNTSGRTVFLIATASLTAAQTMVISCDGVVVAAVSNGGTGAATFYVNAPIPNGSVYSITSAAALNARELR